MNLPTDQNFILFLLIVIAIFVLATLGLSATLVIIYKQARAQLMDYSSRLTAKEIDIKNYALRYDDMAAELSTATKKLLDYETDVAQKEITITALTAEVELYKDKASELNKKIKTLKTNLKSTTTDKNETLTKAAIKTKNKTTHKAKSTVKK